MHPLFNGTTFDYDIALLKLKNKAKLDAYVQPACFPDDTIDFPIGEECYVTGWGKSEEKGNYSTVIIASITCIFT